MAPSCRADTTKPSIWLMKNLGAVGRICPEADVQNSDLETVINGLLDGQYKNRLGVIAFHRGAMVSERVGRPRPCTASTLRLIGRELPESIRDFAEHYAGNPNQRPAVMRLCWTSPDCCCPAPWGGPSVGDIRWGRLRSVRSRRNRPGAGHYGRSYKRELLAGGSLVR
jgi:hypothetical protein